jgi:WD40 repeat protein
LSGVECNTTGYNYGSHPCLPDERSFSQREPLILIAHKDQVQVCNLNPGPGTLASLKHDSEVSATQFSMDGATILTGCVDGKVTVWDTRSHTRIGEPLPLDGTVCAFSRDGTRAITAGASDNQEEWVRLWKIDLGAHKAMAVGQKIGGKFLSISEDGRRLCVATSGEGIPLEIHFRDLDSCEDHTKPLANVPSLDTESIEASSFGRGSRNVVAIAIRRFENDLKGEGAFATGQVRVWDSFTGNQLSCMRHETHGVNPSEGLQPYQASLSPDGNRVASVAFEDRSLPVWDSKSGRMANEPIRGQAFDDVTFSPDGRYILTASYSGVAQIWDIQPLVPIIEPTVMVSQIEFTETRFSDDAKFLLLTNKEGQQQCFDVETAQPTLTLPPVFAKPISKWENFTGTRRFVNIDPEESGDEGDKHLIDTATGKPLLPEIRVRGSTVRSVSFSSDGKRLLIGSSTEGQGSELELRSAETGKRLRESIFDCSEGWFSPAGDEVIMNTKSGLGVLDIATGRELIDRIPFVGAIDAVSITSDGVLVVSGLKLYHFDFLDRAPALLADIAESIAQQRLNYYGIWEQGFLPITKLREMTDKLDERETPHAFVNWARWFLTPRENRPIAPKSQRTLREYIQQCIDSGSEESLHEAALLAVGDKELLDKILVMHAKQ